jgi:rRNA maturation endonuclease Nob1
MLVRRYLGCSATYEPEGHACPECGSHAGEVEEVPPEEVARHTSSKPARRRAPKKS